MKFFKNRAYQKKVLGWMKALLEIGEDKFADEVWRGDPSLKESASALREAGEPAIMAAAELWRRLFLDQLKRAREADRQAIYAYLAGEREDSPDKFAEICLGYCQQLRQRGKQGDIDAHVADIYIDEILQAAQGINSAETRETNRLFRAFMASSPTT